MFKIILSILFVIFSVNSAYALVDFDINEHIEDMERARAQWDKTRLQIVSSSHLSHEEIAFLDSLKQDRKAFITSTFKSLLRGPYEGNFKTTFLELEKIDQHYLNYLRHNLSKNLYGELASKRYAFKMSNGEKIEVALKTDFEI